MRSIDSHGWNTAFARATLLENEIFGDHPLLAERAHHPETREDPFGWATAFATAAADPADPLAVDNMVAALEAARR